MALYPLHMSTVEYIFDCPILVKISSISDMDWLTDWLTRLFTSNKRTCVRCNTVVHIKKCIDNREKKIGESYIYWNSICNFPYTGTVYVTFPYFLFSVVDAFLGIGSFTVISFNFSSCIVWYHQNCFSSLQLSMMHKLHLMAQSILAAVIPWSPSLLAQPNGKATCMAYKSDVSLISCFNIWVAEGTSENISLYFSIRFHTCRLCSLLNSGLIFTSLQVSFSSAL